MQLIPFLLVVDAMVSGSLMMHDGDVRGGSITLQNTAVTMRTDVNSDGKYSMSVPPGTYEVVINRTMGGRKKTFAYQGLTVREGTNSVDLFWPSIENLAARTAFINDEYRAGKAAAAAGQHMEAASHFSKALQQDVSQHALWGELAVAHVMASTPDVAEGIYTEARLWGAGAPTAANMGHAYYKRGRHGMAGAKYKEAAELDPSRAGTYLANAGAAYYTGRMMPDAEAAYKMASEVPGAISSSWYYWGVCAQSNGNRDAALAGLRGYLNADANGKFAADARQRVASLGG
jgi:tetratricopeptide (TPR) repeat protein